MKYNKSPKTYEEQADLLLSRGLEANRDILIEVLKNVNYYRLSGYLYCFRNSDDSFHAGTTLDMVWRRYRFDRQLRFLILDGIERVEVALRSRLVYYFSHQYGPFGYLDKKTLPNLDCDRHDDFIEKIKTEMKRSKEGFVVHFNKKYGEENSMPPLWIGCELFSFGLLLTFYRGVEKSLQQHIARDLSIPDVVLFSWLLALNNLRNLCAHHGRVYDKEFRIKVPTTQHKYPDWFNPFSISGNRLFTVLTVIRYLLTHVAFKSQWHVRLNDLLEEYSDIPLSTMGFPEKWKDVLFWEDLK